MLLKCQAGVAIVFSFLLMPAIRGQVPGAAAADSLVASVPGAVAPVIDHSAAAAPALHDGVTGLSFEAQGDALAARGNYAAALHAYQQATPRTAAVWNKMGMAYHHFFALDAAEKHYRMAIRLDPDFAAAYNNLGAVYHSKRDYGAAEKAYKNAIRCDPGMAVSHGNLGTTYFAEGKDRQGAEAYRQAIALDPEVFKAGRLNRIEEGVPRAQRIATAYNLAKAYAGAGKNEEALAALQQALTFGFRDRRHLLADHEFSLLRATPAFRQLLIDRHLD